MRRGTAVRAAINGGIDRALSLLKATTFTVQPGFVANLDLWFESAFCRGGVLAQVLSYAS